MTKILTAVVVLLLVPVASSAGTVGLDRVGLSSAGSKVRLDATGRVTSNAIPGNVRFAGYRNMLSRASIGKVAKLGLRLGARTSLPLTIAMTAADYLLSDIDGDGSPEIVRDADKDGKPDRKQQTCSPYYVGRSGGAGCSSTQAAEDTVSKECTPDMQCQAPQPVGGQRWQYRYRNSFGTEDIQTFSVSQQSGTHTQENAEPEIVPDEEVGQEIANNRRVLNALQDDIQSNRQMRDAADPGISNWLGELRSAVSQAEQNQAQNPKNYEIPSILERSNPTRPQRTPERQGQQQNVEVTIPTGCDLLDAVCQIRDWLFDESNSDFPSVPGAEPNVVTYDESDFSVENRLPGGGSCPNDPVFEFLGQSTTIPWWSTTCDYLEMIRPATIAFGWLIALLIVSRGNN